MDDIQNSYFSNMSSSTPLSRNSFLLTPSIPTSLGSNFTLSASEIFSVLFRSLRYTPSVHVLIKCSADTINLFILVQSLEACLLPLPDTVPRGPTMATSCRNSLSIFGGFRLSMMRPGFVIVMEPWIWVTRSAFLR